MTQVQSGILLEHCRFAIFMEAKVQGELDAIRLGCKKILSIIARVTATISR